MKKEVQEQGNDSSVMVLPWLQKELSADMKAKIRAEYLAVGGSPDKPLSSNYFLNIILAIAFLALLSSWLTSSS